MYDIHLITMLVYLGAKDPALFGRSPGGGLSRKQRKQLRRAGLPQAVIAGLSAPGPVPDPAPGPPAPPLRPAPVPASGEVMNAETGGVSAPAEHQQQQQ